ncbi:MAG: hypothetical protein COA88_14040 [Kordia sp.]|nr:MAG: hypothetical protein COA88_14040 [Kordia sp.]
MKKIIPYLGVLFTALLLIACQEKKEQPKTKINAKVLVPQKEKLPVITSEGIMHIKVNQVVDEDNKNLVAVIHKDGEGGFDGYNIIGKDGEKIGFAFTETKNIIDLIQIENPMCKTEKGLSVGATFADLKKIYPQSTAHGSEVEGRVSIREEGLSYLLDYYSSNYNLDDSKISLDTKIRCIYIHGKQKQVHEAPKQVMKKYICYTMDNNKKKRIWIGLDAKENAVAIKYEGQKEVISLQYSKEEYLKGGAHPTIIRYYKEIYQNKVNGIYKLTHSGLWDYVQYIRGKDGKKFNFTIDHDANPYGSSPCF